MRKISLNAFLIIIIGALNIVSCGAGNQIEGVTWSNLNFPTSGFEPIYEPQIWNDNGIIQYSTNCYAYALNMMDGFSYGDKLQPGELSGNMITELSVKSIVDASIADAEATGRIFQRAETDKACPSNTYKVALVIAPGVDYHWYRQNPDGTWSHKPGHTEVTNEDASGKTIKDPQRADRNYNEIGVNYSEFGGYYCTGSK